MSTAQRILDTVSKLDHSNGLGVSGKYKAINTADLVRMFERNGFAVTSVSCTKTRTPDRQIFAKHMLRLRPHGFNAVDGVYPEIILRNSFDGSCAYSLKLGLFRLVCSNGMVTGKTYHTVRVIHLGDAVQRVLESAQLVMRQSQRMLDTIDAFKAIQLSYDAQQIFASRAGLLVVPETADNMDTTALLARRRDMDQGNDLWTVLNVVQENLMRGNSVRYQTFNETTGKVRNSTVRRINAIDRSVTVNAQLWDLAEDFAKNSPDFARHLELLK